MAITKQKLNVKDDLNCEKIFVQKQEILSLELNTKIYFIYLYV